MRTHRFEGVVASFTGGELFFYPRFKEAHDGPTLISQFRRLISRTQAYNCTMRVRCSKGENFQVQLWRREIGGKKEIGRETRH